MNKWMILGISATEDKDAIKKAYMEQLPKYNPEEDPEGFVRLRAAYEDILKEIDDKAKDENKEATPVELFIGQVKDVYNDFHKRCDISVWKKLLEDEACARLDLADITEEELLAFFMDNYYLPKDVWQLLDNHFGWQLKPDALKQLFPPQFIDFILDNIKQESINYKLFSTDGEAKTHQFDRFIWLYYEIEACISNGNVESDRFKEAKEEIENLPVKHVYYELQMARMFLTSEPKKAMEIAVKLFEKMPEDSAISHVYGLSLLSNDRAKEALEHFKALHEKHADDSWAKRGSAKGIVEAMIKLEDYEAARTLLLDILAEFPYDSFAQSAIWLITTELVKVYEKKHEEAPEDQEVTITLAKHYLNCEQINNCVDVLEKISPAPDDVRYYEYLAVGYDRTGNFEKSGQFFEKLIAKEKKYRYYVDFSTMLLASFKNDEAITRAEEGLTVEDDDMVSKVRLYGNKGLALFNLGKFDEALDALDQGLAINDEMANLYVYKARIYQETGRYGEAIDCCERAIFIFPYMTDPYTIQMEVYNNSGMFEQMLDIAAWAEQVGWESPRIKYHKAGALRMLGDTEQAREIIEALLADEFDEGYRDFFHVEAGHLAEARGDFDTALTHMNKAIEIAPDFVYRKALLANTYRLKGEFKTAISICNALLDEQPDFLYALLMRGDVYFDQKKYNQARADFEAMIAIHPENEQAYDRIVSTYVEEKLYGKAIEWTLRRMEIFETVNNYLDLAYLYDCNDQQVEAKATYEKLLDRFPETGAGHRYYGFYLSRKEKHEEAIEQYKLSLEKDPQQPELYEEWAFSLRLQKRYDEALKILDEGEAMAAGNKGTILMQRGFVYERMCRYEESLKCMIDATKLPEEIPGWTLAGIYNEIGITYKGNFNDADNAMKYFEMALELDENFADVYENLGYMFLYHLKDYGEAIKCYDRAIKLRPDEPRTYVERAKAWTKQKALLSSLAIRSDYKMALSIYERKSKEEPSPCYYVYISVCKLGLGKLDNAKEVFLSMLDTPSKEGAWCSRPKCDSCLYWLGQIYDAEKNYAEALKYYEEAAFISDSIKHNSAIEEVKKHL